ncbi:MAG: DNA repair protein [Gammaproteobacteria bacterium]|nr:MAG: DNA repair protein [Gammaproteobacteria bacterium]
MKRLLIIVSVLFLFSCQSAYYSTMEKFGIEKRDILVDRVEAAKESQEGAQEQFSSALEQFIQLTNYQGGELQKVYENLKEQFENSQYSAELVSDRVDKVETVADDLFDEWNEEIKQYSNNKLRRDSQKKLNNTKRRYNSLLKAMRKAESKMAPVLTAMNDNVLYLKHNLNANAISGLQGEFGNIKQDINQLIKEMKIAIEQSNDFISSMKN